MRSSRALISLVVSLTMSAATAAPNIGDGAAAAALDLLRRQDSRLVWSPKPVVIDIDCDGKRDFVFIAQSSNAASVGVVLGRKTNRVTVLTFAVDSSDQDSLCAVPVSIEPEPLDYDPTDAVGKLPGFVRSKSGTAFVLSDGECDPFHFYWNNKDGRLDWWRL